MVEKIGEYMWGTITGDELNKDFYKDWEFVAAAGGGVVYIRKKYPAKPKPTTVKKVGKPKRKR